MMQISGTFLRFITVIYVVSNNTNGMVEKLEITLTDELLKKMDELLELMGFRSREEFVVAAVLRLIDKYSEIAIKAH